MECQSFGCSIRAKGHIVIQNRDNMKSRKWYFCMKHLFNSKKYLSKEKKYSILSMEIEG